MAFYRFQCSTLAYDHVWDHLVHSMGLYLRHRTPPFLARAETDHGRHAFLARFHWSDGLYDLSHGRRHPERVKLDKWRPFYRIGDTDDAVLGMEGHRRNHDFYFTPEIGRAQV